MADNGKDHLYLVIQEAKNRIQRIKQHDNDATRNDLDQVLKDLESIKTAIENDQFEKIPYVAMKSIQLLADWAKEVIDMKTMYLTSHEYVTKRHNKGIHSSKKYARSFLVFKAIEHYQSGFTPSHSELANLLLLDHEKGKYREIAGVKVAKEPFFKELKSQMKYFGFSDYIKTGRPSEEHVKS